MPTTGATAGGVAARPIGAVGAGFSADAVGRGIGCGIVVREAAEADVLDSPGGRAGRRVRFWTA